MLFPLWIHAEQATDAEIACREIAVSLSEAVHEILVRAVEIAFEQYPVRLVVQSLFHQRLHADVEFVRITFA